MKPQPGHILTRPHSQINFMSVTLFTFEILSIQQNSGEQIHFDLCSWYFPVCLDEKYSFSFQRCTWKGWGCNEINYASFFSLKPQAFLREHPDTARQYIETRGLLKTDVVWFLAEGQFSLFLNKQICMWTLPWCGSLSWPSSPGTPRLPGQDPAVARRVQQMEPQLNFREPLSTRKESGINRKGIFFFKSSYFLTNIAFFVRSEALFIWLSWRAFKV